MAPRFLVYTAFDLSVWIILNNCYFPATIQISQESWILILLLSSQSLWRLFQRVRYKDISCFQNMLYKISRIELLKAVSPLLVWSFIMKNDIHVLNWNWMSKCCYICTISSYIYYFPKKHHYRIKFKLFLTRIHCEGMVF